MEINVRPWFHSSETAKLLSSGTSSWNVYLTVVREGDCVCLTSLLRDAGHALSFYGSQTGGEKNSRPKREL